MLNKNKKIIKKIEHIESSEKNSLKFSYNKKNFLNKKYNKNFKHRNRPGKKFKYHSKIEKNNFENKKIANY